MKKLLLFLLIIPFLAKAQDLEKLMTFYGEGQFEKAIAFGEEVLKKDSNNIETNLMIGRAYADLGSYNKAIGYLQKATSDTIVQKWKPAWANAYLGTCYFALGNYEMSKKHYEASIALKATKNCDRYTLRRYPSLPINNIYKTWETIESEHFRFHFQDKKEIKNADDFIKRREEALVKINQFFNCNLTQKIEFYVWNNSEEATKILSQPLGFSVPELFIIQSANNQTTGHEITHIICYQTLKTASTSQLINEGIAVYFDQTKRNKMATAQMALKGKSLDVYDLWTGRQGNADVLYPVGGAFIEYLMNQGTSDQLKKLLTRQSVENAKNIYPNLDQLVKEFEKKFSASSAVLTDSAIRNTVVFNKPSEYPIIKLDTSKKFDMKTPGSSKMFQTTIKPTLGVIIDASEYLKNNNIDYKVATLNIDFNMFHFKIKEDYSIVVDKRNLKPMMPIGKNFLGFWGDGEYTLTFYFIKNPNNPRSEGDCFTIHLTMEGNTGFSYRDFNN